MKPNRGNEHRNAWARRRAEAWHRHGLTADQFGRLTPAEYREYDRAWLAGEMRHDMRNGRLCALLFNIHKGKGQRPAKWEDFAIFDYGSIRRASAPKKQRPAEPEDMVNIMDGLVKMTGGK